MGDIPGYLSLDDLKAIQRCALDGSNPPWSALGRLQWLIEDMEEDKARG